MSQDRNSRRRGATGGLAFDLAGLLAGGGASGMLSAHRVPGWPVGTAVAFTSSRIFLPHAVVAYQAWLLPLIGALGLMALVSLMLWRRQGRSNGVDDDTTSKALSSLQPPNTLERIMVYADESMLQRRALLLAVCVGALAAATRWATVSHADARYVVMLGILLFVAAVHLTLAVARLFMDSPTLIIGPEGIRDHASLVVTGSGLLRWDEISRVVAREEKTLVRITYRSLRIYLDNKALVRARQPLWKRLLALVAGGFSPTWVTVYRGLLDEPPETLAVRITQYAQTAATAGWRLPNPPEGSAGNSGDIWRM